MKGEEETRDGREEEESSERVELSELLKDGSCGLRLFVWEMEEENEESDDDGAAGKVDVETPSPGSLFSEDTTKKGTDNTGNPEHSTNQALVDGTFGERDSVHDDYDAPVHHPSATHSSDRPANDKDDRGGCSTTDSGSNFEYENCRKEDWFGRVEGVDAAPDKLE